MTHFPTVFRQKNRQVTWTLVTFASLIIENSINSGRKRLLPQNIGLDAKRGDRLTFS